MAGTAPATGPASRAPSPAVAPPPGNPRFPLFDSLRGLAVLAVVVFHVFLLTGALNRRGIGDAVAVLGSLGPVLFFALSGFLLYRPWVVRRPAGREPPSVARYARRRALRILPAYWFALTALAVFPGIAGVYTGDWWRYYFFLQLYDPATLGLGIPVAWTLCVEVSFYVLLPLWGLALRRVRHGWIRAELAALAGLAACGALVQAAAARQALPLVLSQSLPGQIPWFAVGMALAVASVAEHHGGRRAPRLVIERPGLCWLGAALAVAGLTLVRRQQGGLLGIVAALNAEQPYPKIAADVALTAAFLALVLLPATFGQHAGGHVRRLLAARPLALLGLISYGVFLWHLTIAELLILPAAPGHFDAAGLDLAARLPAGRTAILLVLTLAVSCAVAAASYRVIELPFLRRKER